MSIKFIKVNCISFTNYNYLICIYYNMNIRPIVVCILYILLLMMIIIRHCQELRKLYLLHIIFIEASNKSVKWYNDFKKI